MEFADQGGEGATPYEVLLHAALRGDSTRFTRQDGVEETWRVMQPLLDAPPPVHTYAPGSWGPAEADRLTAEYGGWHSPWIDVMNDAAPQSAAAPSPFPPIADYAFLSNCHTGALIAPDGAVDWLCVPELRLAQRVRHAARPSGGLLQVRAVRDQPPDLAGLRARLERPLDDVEDAVRLGPGPRRADDGPTRVRGPGDAAHPASGGRRRRPSPRANGPLPGGHRRDGSRLRAGLRLRPDAGGVDDGRRGPTCRRRDRRRTDHPTADRPRARCGGQPGPGPARALGRRGVLLRPVVGRRTGRAGRRRRGQRAAWTPLQASGVPGWDGRGCPTTAGATRSSARH